MGTTLSLVWSNEEGGRVALADARHLEQELRRLHEACDARPIVVTVEGIGDLEVGIGIGLGASESIVLLHRDNDDGSRDEWVTIGDPKAVGEADFWFQSNHHTQFERRHLIPIGTAVAVVLHLAATGSRSDDVAWEHQVA